MRRHGGERREGAAGYMRVTISGGDTELGLVQSLAERWHGSPSPYHLPPSLPSTPHSNLGLCPSLGKHWLDPMGKFRVPWPPKEALDLGTMPMSGAKQEGCCSLVAPGQGKSDSECQ